MWCGVGLLGVSHPQTSTSRQLREERVSRSLLSRVWGCASPHVPATEAAGAGVVSAGALTAGIRTVLCSAWDAGALVGIHAVRGMWAFLVGWLEQGVVCVLYGF